MVKRLSKDVFELGKTVKYYFTDLAVPVLRIFELYGCNLCQDRIWSLCFDWPDIPVAVRGALRGNIHGNHGNL